MHIGLFTDTYLPDLNGCAQSVDVLARNLRKLGHKVTIVCSGNELKTEIEGDVIKIPGIEAKKLYGYKVSGPFQPQFLKEAKELNFDIIHAETEFGIGILANIIAHILHIPLVRTYHTDYVDYTHYFISEDLPILYKGAYEFVSNITRVYGDDCLRLMTPSNKTKEMLLTTGIKTKIDVVPNGIELDRFDASLVTKEKRETIRKELKVKDNEKLLIYVGRIADEKRVDLVIKTFVKVKEKALKIKLGIVGKGTAYDKNVELVKELNLEDYVVLLGPRDSSLVPEYYASSDGFISASTSETQGLTYIEALASSLPIIVAYDDVLKDLVNENVNGFFFNDESSCFEAINKFNNLSDVELKKMKENALESTKIYSGLGFAKTTEKIYQDVIEEYANSYRVIKTNLRDDVVTIKVKNDLGDEKKIVLNVDDFVNQGFRKDSIITKDLIEELLLKENEVLAYQSAIRKLAIKDYSIEQMKKSLKQKYEISLDVVNVIINRLIDADLLNDENYAIARIKELNDKGMSYRLISYKLKNDGISEDIIKKYHKENNIDETNKIINKAEKYKKIIHGKSINAKKKAILTKLINDGFNIDSAKKVVEDLDFKDELLAEDELLKIQAEKAYLKYRNKYESYELRNKVFQYLALKGYNQESIYAVIVEMGL